MGVVVSANSGKVFIPAPEGTHQGVCCDVVDLGMVEKTYEGRTTKKHMVKVVWQINEINEDTKRRFTVNRQFGASLHEKSTLRGVLEGWRGRPFTKEELEGFDLDNLLGVNCLLGVIHKQGSKGGTFANVANVAKVMKGMPLLAVESYVREQDRPKDGEAPQAEEHGREPGEDDDEPNEGGF
jgi:hypothetical protein